jgi:polysaccharide export outer membrane protein
VSAFSTENTTVNARYGIGALALLAAGLAACSSPGPYVWVNHLTPQETPDEPLVQPRDTILVEVKNQANMTGEFTVREDGHYTQPLLGSVRVEGATPSAVAQTLSGLLRGMVNDPRVAVWISRPAPIRVNVVGEIKTPGTFELTRDRTVLGALSAAGWLTEFAKKEDIFVVRMSDKQRIRFRVSDVTSPTGPATRFRLRDGDAVIVE